MSNLYAHIGVTKIASLNTIPNGYTSVSTAFLKPCVGLFMFNAQNQMAAVSHLRTRFRVTESDVFKEIADLNDSGFPPNETYVAIIGGNDVDDFPEDKAIQNSRRMVSALESALKEERYSIHHRDLYGTHQRRATLDFRGHLTVDDDFDKSGVKYPYTIPINMAPDVSNILEPNF